MLATLTIRWVCSETARVAGTSVLLWEHRQTWPCNGWFSCSSHLCWQQKIMISPIPTIMENPREEVRSAPSSTPKTRFYCAPFAELLCNFMACRIQQLYQRSLMSTLGPKSTSWIVVKQSSVWGWRAAKLVGAGKAPRKSLYCSSMELQIQGVHLSLYNVRVPCPHHRGDGCWCPTKTQGAMS